MSDLLTSKERVSDEVLAERIEAAGELLQHGYQSRTMRETLLIAEELRDRRSVETSGEPVQTALGCFEAALAEGWIDALANGDVDRIRDLWTRRISFAQQALTGAYSPAETIAPTRVTSVMDFRVTVCSECLCACCWLGEFYCDDYKEASTVLKTVRELKALGPKEDPGFWFKSANTGKITQKFLDAYYAAVADSQLKAECNEAGSLTINKAAQ